MQRVRMSLPHYRENGWEPIILAVDPASHGGPREEALLATIPAEITIFNCRAFSLRFARWFGIGNLGLRSWLHLLVAGWKIIRREKIDLVFISNSQFITFTLGRVWRFLLGVPYVIDLQDPWRTNYYQGAQKKDRPGGWKYDLALFQAGILEGWSFKRMSGLMSVSQSYIDDLRRSYRWFLEKPAEMIGFGASKTDLVAAVGSSPRPTRSGDGKIHLVYTGVAGPVMEPALNVLFDGLSSFRNHCPEVDQLHFDFFGTSYAPSSSASPSVAPLAHAFGAEDRVSEQPIRIGHLQAIRQQATADGLLLLGTLDAAYSPSKLYPYFLANRPMLAVVMRGSSLENQLNALSCAVVVSFDRSGPTEHTRAQLAAFFLAALAGFPATSLPRRNEELFQREYLADSLTRRQCALFDRALSEHNRTAKRA